MSRNIRLTLRYDGAGYHGWQRQNNAVTIQQVVEEAVGKICGLFGEVSGCSRTDAGVHAEEFVCNFHSDTTIPTDHIPAALNSALPPDIAALSAREMDEGFHARFDCTAKEYVYRILNTKIRDPFWEKRAWHYPYAVGIERMREGAQFLVGEHDFSAFMAAGGTAKTTVRRVKYCDVVRNGDLIELRICADGFLYNMVRIITGTLLYVGQGKILPGDILDILKAGKREQAGPTAPPDGLYLARVDY